MAEQSRELDRQGNRSLRDLARPAAVAVAGLALVACGLTWPVESGETLLFVLENLLWMAPIIAMAVGVTAYIGASGADALIAEIFAGRRIRMILAASLVGAVTPICGVGVLPLIAALLSSGVPLAPVMAFWLASPVTAPAMFLITLGTLGPGLAVAKTVAAFAIGLLGGLASEALLRRGAFADPLRPGGLAAAAGGCSGGPKTRDWRPWRDPERRRQMIRSAGRSTAMMVKWLSLAFALEALLRRALPPEAIAGFLGGDNAWAIPLAVLVGTPIYLDGYAALPLVRGLIELGMSEAAALAFLVAGGITSLYASLAVFALVRWPLFLWYLGLAVAGSLLAGYGYQALAAPP